MVLHHKPIQNYTFVVGVIKNNNKILAFSISIPGTIYLQPVEGPLPMPLGLFAFDDERWWLVTSHLYSI